MIFVPKAYFEDDEDNVWDGFTSRNNLVGRVSVYPTATSNELIEIQNPGSSGGPGGSGGTIWVFPGYNELGSGESKNVEIHKGNNHKFNPVGDNWHHGITLYDSADGEDFELGSWDF